MQRAAQQKSQHLELRRHANKNVISEKIKKSTITSNPPTVVSFVTDALVFRVEHGLFQHAEDDDRADPELDPQQIPPVTGAPQEPESPEQHIHDAHDHEELWGGVTHVRPMMGDTTDQKKKLWF